MHNLARSFPLPTEFNRARTGKPTSQSQADAKRGLAELFGLTLRTKLADCGYGVEVYAYPVPVTYRKHRRACIPVSA